MLSQRGQMMLVHNRHQREGFRRVMNAIQVNGVDAEWLEADEVFAREPTLNRNGRFPILGAVNQARAGTARHDAVARSEEHTSELQSLMRISYAVFCLNKTTNK